LHLYPTWGRFYLFFTPAMVILIAAGVQALMEAGTAPRMPLGAGEINISLTIKCHRGS
jgi:hypothetical protein